MTRPGRFDVSRARNGHRPGQFDTSIPPSLLRHNEVFIGDHDPYQDGALPHYELWFDTRNSEMYARVEGQWRLARPPNEQEVYIGPQPPPHPGGGAEQRMVLRAKLNGVEQVINDDVFVGDTAPDTDQVVWCDTSTTPSVLKVKANGFWYPIATPPNWR